MDYKQFKRALIAGAVLGFCAGFSAIVTRAIDHDSSSTVDPVDSGDIVALLFGLPLAVTFFLNTYSYLCCNKFYPKEPSADESEGQKYKRMAYYGFVSGVFSLGGVIGMRFTDYGLDQAPCTPVGCSSIVAGLPVGMALLFPLVRFIGETQGCQAFAAQVRSCLPWASSASAAGYDTLPADAADTGAPAPLGATAPTRRVYDQTTAAAAA